MNAPIGVYGPHPVAAAVIAAAVFAAIFLTCLALLAAGSAGDRWGRRKHPAPGHPPRPPSRRDAVTPQRQHAPAPGPAHGTLEESDAAFLARLERELREP